MNGMVMAGSGEVTSRHEYGLLIQSARLGEIDDGLLRPLLENRVDGGILFLSGSPRQRDVYIRRVVELDHPFVLFGESREGAHPAVTADNAHGAFRLAEHLLERGHRRIAFIAGQASWPMIEQRHAGYRAALREHGIEPARELQLFRGRFDPAAGEAMAEALLELRDPPTAIMAANDVLALGVFRAAQHRRLAIPADVAITGFNDFDFAPFLGPGLTTASVPMYEMGKTAGAIVVDQLEGLDGERQKEFPAEVIIRGSS